MQTDPLVSAAWLKEKIGAADLRVLDATWVPPFLKDRPNGSACYAAGHIPGAAYFDIDVIADSESGLKHMLPYPAQFSEQVAALGISNKTQVIVYDSNGFFASARAWWMFRAMGHDAVYVLDGGLEAWKASGGEVDTTETQVRPGIFKAQARPELVRDMAAVRMHVEDGDATILDARAQGRFDGTSPEPRPDLPSGHMPGSICVPVTDLMTQDGRLKSEAELKSRLSDFLEGPVVTSCGSGVSAAVISLALARAGNWSAALYDGSWSEWAAQSSNPIETRS